MSINDGGPAYPGLHPSAECRYNGSGMSLRDHFAGLAMQVIRSSEYNEPQKITVDFEPLGCVGLGWKRNKDSAYWYYSADEGTHRLATSHEDRVARDAYAQADAMIAAREATP